MKLSKNIVVGAVCFSTCVLTAIPGASARTAPNAAASARKSSPTDPFIPPPGLLNVLVIVLDDVGTDQFKVYAVDPGPPPQCTLTQVSTTPTPTLDVLRATGILFTRAYANPVCSPTRACLMTGRHGMRTGVGAAIDVGTLAFTLPSSEVFLPELIRDNNTRAYARGAFGKWHLADPLSQDCHPAENGFETFQGTKGNLDDHFTWRKVTATGGSAGGCSSTLSETISPVGAPSETSWDAAVTERDAAAWINQQTRPFFAYVCFNPPHVPIEVPPTNLLSKKTRAKLASLGYETGERPGALRGDQTLIYHSEIEAIDREIFNLLLAIVTKLPSTMVIVVGDNGTPVEAIENLDLSDHVKRSVHELGVRVPMIVSGPLAWFHAGSTCRNLVNAVDVWRTVGNITGISNATIDSAIAATGKVNDSISFLGSIQNPAGTGLRAFAYSEAFANHTPPVVGSWLRGMTDGTYRYIRLRAGSGAFTEQLYNVLGDACELVDLTKPPHVLTAQEQAALAALSAAMNAL